MRKKLTAVILAVLVFSLIAASAASLGGINTANIGAEVDVVASCDDTGVRVDFTTSYDIPAGEYLVTEVVVSLIDAGCVGSDLSVTLSDGVIDDENTNLSIGAGGTETVSGFSFSAEDLTAVAVLITG